MSDERIFWYGNVPYRQVKQGMFWVTKERIKPTAAAFVIEGGEESG